MLILNNNKNIKFMDALLKKILKILKRLVYQLKKEILPEILFLMKIN